LIPGFDGALFSQEWRDALWARFYMAAPRRQRRSVERFHYDGHDQLRRHLQDFIDAYNFGRRLKTLKGLTPYEFICKRWTSEPDLFIIDPIHQILGLNTGSADPAKGTIKARSRGW